MLRVACYSSWSKQKRKERWVLLFIITGNENIIFWDSFWTMDFQKDKQLQLNGSIKAGEALNKSGDTWSFHELPSCRFIQTLKIKVNRPVCVSQRQRSTVPVCSSFIMSLIQSVWNSRWLAAKLNYTASLQLNKSRLWLNPLLIGLFGGGGELKYGPALAG